MSIFVFFNDTATTEIYTLSLHDALPIFIAILTFTPVRQREIRELQIGKNLARGPDGWWVTLNADEHKTGSKTGKGRRSEEHTSELQSRQYLVCRLLLEKKKHNDILQSTS